MVSGVSILNFCALRNWFKLLRSNMGLHLLLGLGTKNSWLGDPGLSGNSEVSAI